MRCLHTQYVYADRTNGIPEERFLLAAEPILWVSVREGCGGGLPKNRLRWPKSPHVEQLADQLLIVAHAKGSRYEPRGGRYYRVLQANYTRFSEVSQLTFAAYVVGRSILVTRLTRFLRGIGRIDKAGHVKRRRLLDELECVGGEIAQNRSMLPTSSAATVARIKSVLKQHRLSEFNARRVATTDHELAVFRIGVDGAVVAYRVSFDGCQLFGKWRVREAHPDRCCWSAKSGKVLASELSDAELTNFRSGLQSSNYFSRPAAIDEILNAIATIQLEGERLVRPDRAQHGHAAGQVGSRLRAIDEALRRLDCRRLRRARQRRGAIETFDAHCRQQTATLLGVGRTIRGREDFYAGVSIGCDGHVPIGQHREL